MHSSFVTTWHIVSEFILPKSFINRRGITDSIKWWAIHPRLDGFGTRLLKPIRWLAADYWTCRRYERPLTSDPFAGGSMSSLQENRCSIADRCFVRSGFAALIKGP